jgi:hypothetical protein
MQEDVSDSDDDLAPQLLQDKRPSAKKTPSGTSPSKSNKLATILNKGNIRKPHYDLRIRRQDQGTPQ